MKSLKILFLVIIVFTFSCSTTSKVDEGYIDIDDTSIYYKTIGKGEPIIFVHGGPGFSHKMFTPYIDKLSSAYKVVYYDQRGQGLSKGPIDSLAITVDNFVEDIESLRKQLKIEKLNLAGHSWGGILSLHYAIKYPQKLNSLVLFGTAASMDMLIPFFENLQKRRTDTDRVLLDSLEKTDDFISHNPIFLDKYFKIYFRPYFRDPSFSENITVGFNEIAARNYMRVNRLVFSSLGSFNLDSSLSVIKCPTLVLHGSADLFPFEASERIHQNISNSELVIFENSGHWMFIEEETKFISVLGDFLKRIKT